MPTATLLGTSGQGLCVNKPKADDPFQRGEPQATGFSRVVVDFNLPFFAHKENRIRHRRRALGF